MAGLDGPVKMGSSTTLHLMILLVILIASRLIAGSIDGERVSRHIRDLEGTVLDREWKLFGPKWWKRRDSRSYRITYRCRNNRMRRGHVSVCRKGEVRLNTHSIIGDSRFIPHGPGSRRGPLLPEFESRSLHDWL